jgi:hypothetical protein
MSESGNDTVSDAFEALETAIRQVVVTRGSSISDLSRVADYLRALQPLSENWKDGKPASGKVPGKRGRKAGTKNPQSGTSGSDEEGEGEGDDSLSHTQVETDLPPTGRSQRPNF